MYASIKKFNNILLVICILVTVLLNVKMVMADTRNRCHTPDCPYYVMQLNKSSYAAGESIIVTGSVYGNYPTHVYELATIRVQLDGGSKQLLVSGMTNTTTNGSVTYSGYPSAGSHSVTGWLSLGAINYTDAWNFPFTVIAPPPPPNAPTSLSATAGSCGTKTINLSWTKVSGATSYKIYRTNVWVPGITTSVSGNTVTASDSGLTTGQQYQYTVSAVNANGVSAQSSPPVTQTAPSDCLILLQNTPPLPPTITGNTTGQISTDYTFSIVSTDPDNDQIKYGIDWSEPSDGVVEQWLPPQQAAGPGLSATGLVNSGTSLDAIESWAIGSHSFKAITYDSRGAYSTWTTYNIDIVQSTPLAVSCSASPSSMSNPGTVTFTASINPNTDGTSPFYWNGSPTGGTHSTSMTIAHYTGAAASDPVFSVTDSSNPVRTGSTNTCHVNVTSCPGGVCPSSPNTLTVTVIGNGTVTGTGDPISAHNINCGATCTETVATPTLVTLTAAPASGSSFTGWSNSNGFAPACSGTGTCELHIDGPDSVTANFTNGGGISGSCSSSVNASGLVTLVAAPLGQTGTVTYIWNTGVGYVTTNNISTYSYSPGNINYATSVAISDTDGHTGNLPCGTVDVASPTGSSNLKLLIGKSGTTLDGDNLNDSSSPSAVSKSYVVRRGRLFQLKWNVKNPALYKSCSLVADRGSWPWRKAITISSDSIDDIVTSGRPLGRYVFTLSCNKNDKSEQDTSNAWLNIVSSGIQEI
jgi:hypothetical protein